MIKKQLAFVLGGGGARGALQVGALRALLEAGYRPDLITGTSIGAANGAFLAIHGFNHHSILKLEEVWEKTVDQDLLPTNLWWQTMRAVFTKSKGVSQQQIIQFAIQNGLRPELRFRDLTKIRFYPVAADLNSGSPVIFGMDLDESVLDGVLASMALPPWINPLEKEGRYLIDGGAVSNLPVEPALRMGATEIIALDLFDPNFEQTIPSHRVSDFLLKLNKTVENRQAELEIELAKARGVPVHRISLIPEKPVPMWDFRYSSELIERGYHLAMQSLASLPAQKQDGWWQRMGSSLGRVIEGLRRSN